VLTKWASYDLLGAMRQLGTIPELEPEEARVPEDLAILIFGLDAAASCTLTLGTRACVPGWSNEVDRCLRRRSSVEDS
jgi:hypothetical protein